VSRALTEAEKNAAKFPPSKTIAEHILTNAQDSRPVVQDFVPLADSLEWDLGQQYLRDRGNKAFISDASPVPFVVNNDGNLSRNAAEVFFTSLLEADKAGALEPDIHVLELGIGVGLFARFFLDHFQQLCEKHKKDFYDRLSYVAADRSERMLTDVIRHGVLTNHPGRYRLRLVDAMCPQKELPYDAAFQSHPHKERPFRAVFLNYLLDCLPAAVLQFDGDQIKELHVRTCVARNVKLEDFTDMTVDQLKERGKSNDPRAKQELLEVYGLFASEYDHRPVDVSKIPYAKFGIDYARPMTKRFLLSYGAIQSLECLLKLIAEDGFILINDYGQTQTSRDDEFEHQRFSMATFVGVNFPLLKAYFDQPGHGQWIEPHSEAGGIHSRLLCLKRVDEVVIKFWDRFSKSAYDHLHEPIDQARACARAGRFELAATYYNQALERQPRNWVLLNEISMFLTFSLRDLKAGIDMAKMALTLNPTCSAELWNTLGDGLYEFGRTEEARSAYMKALDVNESDVRARYNLAWCHVREKNFPAALEMIAEALALDRTGEYRDRLLQKIQEVMVQVGQRHQQEYLLLINLVSRYAKKDEADKDKPDKPAERTDD
jgi:tetratricopeptide (TPR) repeat protein